MRPSLRLARPSALAAAAVAAAAVVALAPAAPAAPAAEPDLTAAVTASLLTRTVDGVRAADGRTPVVTITREAKGWAFGTAVLAGAPGKADDHGDDHGDVTEHADQHPYGWLFHARLDGDHWTFGFDGEDAFAQLSAESPVTLPHERAVHASHGSRSAQPTAGSDFRTGMQMPWSAGATWTMSGGPHGWAGSNTPYSSLDLHGGDQVVRAARAGTANLMCRGWIRVLHDRGYSTDYYHLWNNIAANGTPVSAGTRLGDTGTDVTCGGSASGRHVHFALRQNGAYVGIGGHNIGKWVPYAGAAYGGYALHGSAIRYPGGALYNYGALGFNQGVIDSNGGASVNKRSGPGTGYGLVGSVADGATVTVSCSSNGTTHTGRYGSTSLWNRLSDGTWVTDAFMWTGVNGPVNGWC